MKKLSDIPKVDKPREKLVSRGVESLSSLELIMILLGSGTAGRDVRTLAKDILKVLEEQKGEIKLKSLTQITGIGIAKGGQILASFELAKRYLLKPEMKINNTEDVLSLVSNIRNKKQEHFVTITLTGASSVIEKRVVFKGTINYSVVHPREIFADALTDRAAGIIFVHNHPEDDAKPSVEDIKVTEQLINASKLLGIQVIDHIIVTKDDYYSFQSEGLI